MPRQTPRFPGQSTRAGSSLEPSARHGHAPAQSRQPETSTSGRSLRFKVTRPDYTSAGSSLRSDDDDAEGSEEGSVPPRQAPKRPEQTRRSERNSRIIETPSDGDTHEAKDGLNEDERIARELQAQEDAAASSRRATRGRAIPPTALQPASSPPEPQQRASARNVNGKIPHHDSEHDDPMDTQEDAHDLSVSSRGRPTKKIKYDEDDEKPLGHEEDDEEEDEQPVRRLRRPQAHSRQLPQDDDYGSPPRVRPRERLRRSSWLAEDEEEMDSEDEWGSQRKSRRLKLTAQAKEARRRQEEAEARELRRTRRQPVRSTRYDSYHQQDEDEPIEDEEEEDEPTIDYDRLDRRPGNKDDSLSNSRSSSRGYGLRRRNEVNYALPTMEQLEAEAYRDSKEERKAAKRKAKERAVNQQFNATLEDLQRAIGAEPMQDSDSSDDGASPRKQAAARAQAAASGGLFAAGAGTINDSTLGAPKNFGKVTANLADIDPLLPGQHINFDSVGGMEGHIQQLKEMVSLPLLYPEVFQRFAITPPRGVLFHGPPGTGKTLLARALASSCSTEGQRISFFMRKGADCLSKWVGEAERQLRMLFEEAKRCQPSIIFFDEIDGLAPVRSSKQEQIHASIVSTLLALMDGMDGRGQVIIIGATNRPDSVDPALRRPGRFDREFYFPLPNLEARRKIIDIHTRDWQPPLATNIKDELAQMTKGYGGADMRALCTEAALNAVQRKYPQIYKTPQRLMIKPETIEISARDFVIAAERLVPSTARSNASPAAALPPHLACLLGPAFEAAKSALAGVLPARKKLNILEEAEYEDLNDAGFETEKFMQSFEASLVHRPRLLISGEEGLGQEHIGAALMQYLEGYHVQSLGLDTLLGDSSSTPEATLVQIFSEAKRHKPSILFIPDLAAWADSISETTRATLKGLLKAASASDPILLLGISETPGDLLPPDVSQWFGPSDDNRMELGAPHAELRRAFFTSLLEKLSRSPKEYNDAIPRRKRILEVLPVAPPPAPREPTAEEVQAQTKKDATLREILKFRIGPIAAELKKRYKRFSKLVGEVVADAALGLQDPTAELTDLTRPMVITVPLNSDEPPAVPAEMAVTNGNGVSDDHATLGEMQPNTIANHANGEVANDLAPIEPVNESSIRMQTPERVPASGEGQEQRQSQAQLAHLAPETPAPPTTLLWHNVNLETIHSDVYRDLYLTPQRFVDDIAKIFTNAFLEKDPDLYTRAGMMLNHAKMMVDFACDEQFKLDCLSMSVRENERRSKRKSKNKSIAQAVESNGEHAHRPSTRSAGQTLEVVSDIGVIERELSRRRSLSKSPLPPAPVDDLAEPLPIVPGGADKADKMGVDTLVNGTDDAMDFRYDTSLNTAPTEPVPDTRSPSPAYPDLNLDRTDLATLIEELTRLSDSFNIEQLEVLRLLSQRMHYRSPPTVSMPR
ncbi:hypothetical protein E5Q_03061 [Mixia osmundae IAM 14324]|uniref:AAA+ ATPase domain-containing protein n=1 Tax=Mixia osmundae (strain CBS 9802 / IAM 14324 / JCM 22182 / KY 12970) TaxID=764103 RepID=G7E0N4_MIXOS|nr:hypothetical protein E5Q_03061 [Mixia osmundae IAM 14324]